MKVVCPITTAYYCDGCGKKFKKNERRHCCITIPGDLQHYHKKCLPPQAYAQK